MTTRRKQRRLPPRLRAALDWAATGAFAAAIAPFMVIPADWTIRAFGALGRALAPMVPASRVVDENLALVRPGMTAAEARALKAAVGDNFGRVLAEYIRMPSVRRRAGRRRVAGIERLREAMAAGRGAVIVSGHLGNWEAIRLAALDHGIEVGLIYRAFNNRPFDRLSRTRIPVAGRPVLHKGPAGARAMLAHLRGGGAMLILVDQRLAKGDALPFLGAPAMSPTAIAAMAARLGAPLIPAKAVRDATGLGFDVTFEPPIAPAAPTAMMAAVNARLGAWIDETPGQWFWLHRRWRPPRRRRAA